MVFMLRNETAKQVESLVYETVLNCAELC